LYSSQDEIVGPRYRAIEAGIIDRSAEPFGVRFKTFWFLEDADKILEGKFAQELLHEPDGLIFQPTKDVILPFPYLYFCIFLQFSGYEFIA
jgi:mRNA-capping enzyme